MNEFEIIHYPQIDGLNLFFDTVDYRTPHVHPELELIWMVEGRLAISCGNQAHEAGQGALVLFNPSQPHEFHSLEERCTFLCLQLSLEGFLRGYPELRRLTVDGIFPDQWLPEEEGRTLRRRLLSLARVYFEQPEHYPLYCEGQAGLILYQLFSRMPTHTVTAGEVAERQKRNARLTRLFAFVDQNYMHKIRLSDFAAMEGRSVSYLSHFIKENTNQTFQDYVNTVRFNAACKRIASGGGRMLDICVESGFSDYRYFSRTFQERTGMTPEEYSRRAQPSSPETIHVHQSIHSLERFYTRETCIRLLNMLERTGEISTKQEPFT